MPQMGEIRVRTTTQRLVAAVNWLATLPSDVTNPRKTLLGSDEGLRDSLLLVTSSLKKRLQKASVRKRARSLITINMPRTEAKALVSVFNQILFKSRLYPRHSSLVGSEFVQDVEKGLSRPGRKTLTDVERAKRLDNPRPCFDVCKRQKKRLRKADKASKKHRDWSSGLRQRGETFLTDTKGPPKI